MRGSVALIDEKGAMDFINQDNESNHTDWLLKHIDILLKRNSLQTADLNGIAVAKGPGSFTGLRIGLATAKGLSLALNIPLIGISSLEAFAYNSIDRSGFIAPLIDARRSQLFAAVYKIEERKLNVVMEEGVFDPDELLTRLIAIKSEILLVGDGVVRYRSTFEKEPSLIIDENMLYSNASGLGLIALERLKSGAPSELVTLKPNYIRKSDAKIKSVCSI